VIQRENLKTHIIVNKIRREPQVAGRNDSDTICNDLLSTMRTKNAQQLLSYHGPKTPVTISTFPEQLTTTLQKRNLPNIQIP
jgi:hypothetical protein